MTWCAARLNASSPASARPIASVAASGWATGATPCPVTRFAPSAAHAHASASAVQTGDTAESGVDAHLAPDTAAHPNPSHGPDHGHAHGGGHGGDHGHHNHEPMLMILPLALLAIGALFAGFLNLPTETFGHKLGHFLGQSPSFKLGYDKASATYDASDWISSSVSGFATAAMMLNRCGSFAVVVPVRNSSRRRCV